MIVFPNAKINIGLHVNYKRYDGFHNLQTYMYPVKDVYDSLEAVEAEQTTLTIYNSEIPGDKKENLVWKAWELMQKEYNIPSLDIHLLKTIPLGSGTGGGSADGAFMISLINEKFKLGLSKNQLESLAAELGSDCAFFINNQPAYCTGRGEIIEAIPLDLSNYQIEIVYHPHIHISTAEAYKHVEFIPEDPDFKNLYKNPIEEWKHYLKNSFETNAFRLYPELQKSKENLYSNGAIFAQMSGSGSAVYGIFKK
jgi:4-diphosphocytidyl-2-C-methyl-D-erythritol kinase